MLESIIENKKWVFSGIGIFILTIIMGLIKWFFSKKKSDRAINMTGEKSVYVEKNKGKIDIK